jgi:hypothetical protein
MVSKFKFQEHGCATIEGYFDYIIDCRFNNKNVEALNLIKDLSETQKREFIEYLDRYDEYETIQVLKYELKQMK